MRALQRVFIFIAALSLVAHEASAQPSTLRSDAWVVNGGQVNAIVHNNGITYIGGEFTSISMATGNGVMLSTRPAALPFPLPRINGEINAVVSDGAGGWYVGGNFTSVDTGDTLTYKRLIRILANGKLDLDWKPAPNKRVLALALHGDRLYVGGDFTSIGGQSISFLAALYAATDQAVSGQAVSEWNPKADRTVRALAVDGPIIYAGGSFGRIGDDTRNRIAAIDSVTGKATTWNPDITGVRVNTIAVAGTIVYVGGNFTNVGAEPRSHIAAINAVNGTPILSWDPKASASGMVNALVVSGSRVYVGGNFTTIGNSSSLSNLAALKVTTGEATGWKPVANDQVNALAINGSTIYAGGGRFTNRQVGTQHKIVAIDTSGGGMLTDWNPNLGNTSDGSFISAIAVSGLTVYAGGNFPITVTLIRNRLAAFNDTTGRPTTWNPNVTGGAVRALAVIGSRVYVGGAFTNVGGTLRNRLAALELATGNLIPAWNPNPDGDINAIDVEGTTVYVGGQFSSIGNINRQPPRPNININVAALDSVNGDPKKWNPNTFFRKPMTANSRAPVNALVVRGSVVYVGGDFTAVGGTERNYLAALDAKTGDLLDWNPMIGSSSNATDLVNALAVSGATIYAGGKFLTPRNSIIAIDAITGIPIDWDPNVQTVTDNSTTSGIVRTITIDGSAVYFGGTFNRVTGVQRTNAASVTSADGRRLVLQVWNPELTDAFPINPVTPVSINAIEFGGATIFVGGNFTKVAGVAHSFFAPLGATQNQVPGLFSISKTEGARLDNLNVIFNGQKFIDDFSSVNVGDGIAVNSVTVTSSTSLTANITITESAAVGRRKFSVTNLPPGGGTSPAILFTVKNPAPILTSLSPDSGRQAETLNVEVAGSKFISGVTTVSFGPDIIVNSITVTSPTRLTANITIRDNAAMGRRDVIISNAFPGGGTRTLTRAFAVIFPKPKLISISPASGKRLQTLDVVFSGAGFAMTLGTTTVITGTNITVNSITVNNSTSLIANLTIMARAAAGARSFAVQNSGPGGVSDLTRIFTVTNPAPTLLRLEPASAARGQTHNIILRGTNFFADASMPSFGPNIIINSFTIDSETQIRANISIPLNVAMDSLDVSVTNKTPGGGTATLFKGFVVTNPRPTLISIMPAIGVRKQKLNVTLTGTNFIDGISRVDFDKEIVVIKDSVVSSTKIVATLEIDSEASTDEPHNVAVSNTGPGGGKATLPKAFAVVGGTIVRFSVPDNLAGSHGDLIEIPLRIDPSSRRLGSFDARLNFDPEVLQYITFTRGPNSFNKWQIEANVTPDSVAVNIGGYNKSDDPITQAETAVKLLFRVRAAARIGTRLLLVLSHLSATNNNAGQLPTEGSNGLLTIAGATVSGKLFYYINKKPIAGDSIRLDVAGTATLFRSSNADGFFEFTGFSFGRETTLTPRQLVNNFPAGIITAGDALRAFKGRKDGSEPLNGYQSLAMDVNNDGKLNSGDCQAILLRAIGKEQAFYWRVADDESIVQKEIRLGDWRFVDGRFDLTAENWFEAPDYRRYSPLKENQTEQYFIGIIRGDVNGSFAAPLAKSAGADFGSGPMVTVSNPALTENNRFACTVAVNTTDRAYNSFDLAVNYDAAAVRITGVALAKPFTSPEWMSDWHAPQPGLLRVAGFAMSEASIKGNIPLLVIEGTLTRPAKENDPLQLAMPLAMFGWDGNETAAQTAIGDLKFVASLPQQYVLEQNYPNPFLRQTPRAATTIKYALPEASTVSLRIYDMLGNLVRTLVAKSQNAGTYTVAWNGRKDNGSPAVSGVYFYRLEAGGFVKTNKLVLQK